MGLVSSIALYFVLWWLCFFVALPIGTRSHVEQDVEVDRGSEAASPIKPNLIKKMLKLKQIIKCQLHNFSLKPLCYLYCQKV